ncbi:MAG: hypothetical protein R6U20_09300 [Longimonas sp.]|uniref:hypothetical protein n=1 Tax=Longimonas sp. TaxID=2039626 RepID=UPI003976D277
MSTLDAFVKAAPEGFQPCSQPGTASYKYFVEGKGCVLGVLFETSTHICFEWLMEDGTPVAYPASIRYKAWPRHEFRSWLAMGVWEVTSHGPCEQDPERPYA